MSEKPNIAVSVRGLSKTYPLYRSARDRLKESFHPRGRKYHRPFDALKGVDLEVPRGIALGIVGRNGSGKSTLLQCICGIVQPTDGELEVNGKIAALLELGAGFNPEFTGRENLYLNASILGLQEEEIDARLPDILAFADIGDFIDQPVRAYSSGMYVRLAFAIAIHVDPDILIVDEALAVGDIHFQAKCFDRFHRFRQQGVTVIFVTHDLNMVTRYCDEAILLDHGEIVHRGNPREVVAEYRKRETDHQPGVSGAVEAGFNVNPYELRYGNRRATIVEGGIYDDGGQPVQTLDSGEAYVVRMRVEINDPLVEPVFAFTIKDARGTEIAGTNTAYSGVTTGDFAPGQVVTVEFTQRITLTAGNFLLSLGCVTRGIDADEIHDRRHDFLAFSVITGRDTIGVVDLDTAITLTRES